LCSGAVVVATLIVAVVGGGAVTVVQGTFLDLTTIITVVSDHAVLTITLIERGGVRAARGVVAGVAVMVARVAVVVTGVAVVVAGVAVIVAGVAVIVAGVAVIVAGVAVVVAGVAVVVAGGGAVTVVQGTFLDLTTITVVSDLHAVLTSTLIECGGVRAARGVVAGVAVVVVGGGAVTVVSSARPVLATTAGVNVHLRAVLTSRSINDVGVLFRADDGVSVTTIPLTRFRTFVRVSVTTVVLSEAWRARCRLGARLVPHTREEVSISVEARFGVSAGSAKVTLFRLVGLVWQGHVAEEPPALEARLGD
jgi:hypothetical protein